MSKHTPGPWEIEEESGGHSITNRSFTGDEWCIAEVYGKTDTSIANANLIAAAPDLLDALESVTKMAIKGDQYSYDDWGQDYVEDPRVTKAKAVIAKARGEAK